MADFPFQTTRAGVQLVLNGVMDRYLGVRIILSHAGGFLPYASLRFAELARVFNPDAASPDALLTSFRRFYFDTALASGPALPTLMAFAGAHDGVDGKKTDRVGQRPCCAQRRRCRHDFSLPLRLAGGGFRKR